MRRLYARTIAVAALALLAACSPAAAFWDEVHYGLTYYVARGVGFTPEQAYRIASATIQTDYAEATAPEQDLSATDEAQDIRASFHAFRDARLYPEDGPAAGAAIAAQRERLYRQCVRIKNPGPFMHFLQDEVSHAGYDTRAGHWVDPDEVSGLLGALGGSFMDTVLGDGSEGALPIGGTTDWLSYRDAGTNAALVQRMAARLTAFMREVSPRQYKQRQQLSAAGAPQLRGDVGRVLEDLAAANPHPQPLGMSDLLPMWRLYKLRQRGERGTPEDEAQYGAHLDGPDTARALAVIRRALAREGMLDADMPERHREYIIDVDAQGAPVVTVGRDLWVVSGELKVKVLMEDENGRTVPVDKGALQVWSVPTHRDERPYLLASGKVPGRGQPVVFRDMPIGTVEVRTTDKKGDTVRKRASLTLEHNELTLYLGGGEADDTPAVVADDRGDEGADEAANVPPLVLTKVSLRRMTVTSEGREEKSEEELRKLGAAARVQLEDASVDVAVALEVPLRLHPGRRFAMAADMRCRAETGREPMTVRLTISPDSRPHDASVTLPAGGSAVRDLKCAVDYTYRYVGQKPYEWNFLYDMRARHGVPRSDKYNERIVKLVIKSDLEPSFEGIELADEGVTRVSGQVPRFRRGRNSFVIEAVVEQGRRKLAQLVFDAIYDLAGGGQFSPVDLDSMPIARDDPGPGRQPGGDDLPPYIARPSHPGDGATPAGPGGTGSQPEDPLAVLRSARPWTDPRVQRAIDSFLSQTKPGVKPREGVPDTWRWTSWGQAVGPGVTAPQAPDTGGMTRYQYLYVQAGGWTSRHHGTLRQYIERFLRGEPTGQDTGGTGSLGNLIRSPGVRSRPARPGGDEDTPRVHPFVGTWKGTLTTWPKANVFGKWMEFRTDTSQHGMELTIAKRGDELQLTTRNFPKDFSGGLMRDGTIVSDPQSILLKQTSPTTVSARVTADVPERLAHSREADSNRVCRSVATLTLSLAANHQLKLTYEGKWWDARPPQQKGPSSSQPGLIISGDAVLTLTKSKRK
ncbi:MAG: hypothetical protein ACE5JM_00055 [Armatimonadota bacterium]